ncbi:glucosaminidase domain-containing protein [Aedoeadaptatus coxii]|uniref:glucosaminidase domain-containing protein n=1 Tax=Aedoeadaptatus coxii TaxID=755172 RepID=UPI002AD32C0C|nr:glucosaminidase domain-containing protein [Peptoniphilus coxii]
MVKILLDPGHGGGRAYNRGFKQVENLPYCNEGDCNFTYARDYLKPALEAYGFTVGMTKSTIAPDIPLKTRGAMGKGYDLLISCHSNACGGGVRGVEVWDSTNPRESLKTLGEKICSNVAVALGIPTRGTKYRRNSAGSNYYGILRHGMAKHNMIVEHAFHDNINDATVYRKNLQKTADAVARAVAEHFGNVKATMPTKTVPVVLDEEKFVQSVADCLKGKKLNVLPSVTIAQAILESGWGRSELAKNAHNLFGIKASKDWKGKTYAKKTKEQKPTGEVYEIVADFRAYDNIAESILDHDAFFVSTEWRRKNYGPVLNAKNYKDQAKALQSCGYATALDYGKQLIGLIERLGLQQYDKGVEKYVTRDIQTPSDWAKDAWEWGEEQGLCDGSRPGAEMTREEMMAVLYRYDQKKGDNHANCHCTDKRNTRFDTGL